MNEENQNQEQSGQVQLRKSIGGFGQSAVEKFPIRKSIFACIIMRGSVVSNRAGFDLFWALG
jgi:hypothetical protein